MARKIIIRKVDKDTELAELLLSYVENCSWTDVREHIAGMIRAWAFSDWATMFAALADGKIVGMASVMKTDYYPLPEIYPWVSCVFVSEDYRGQRVSEELLWLELYSHIVFGTVRALRLYVSQGHRQLWRRYRSFICKKDRINVGVYIDFS